MAGQAKTRTVRQTGAVVIAAMVLFMSGEALAQSAPGGGPLNFLGNLFGGTNGNQTAPANPSQPAPSGGNAAQPWKTIRTPALINISCVATLRRSGSMVGAQETMPWNAEVRDAQ